MTYDEVRKFALTLDGVEEGTSYGTPGLKIRGKLMARYRPEMDALVVATTFEERDELIREQPGLYFITDHYLEYPWVLVNLARVRADAVRDLLRRARQLALAGAKPSKSKSQGMKSKSR